MLSERITKMNFVFVNTATEQKVNKKETQSAENKDFNSYLKTENKATSETEKTSDKTTTENVSEKGSKAKEFERLIKKVDSNNENAETVNQTNEINPEVYSQVMESIKAIMDIIQETFNVSEQEVDNAMTDLGINKTDLLTNSGLNELLSKLAPNGEITNLLVDSDFSKAVKDMFSVIEDIKETLKTDYSLTDEEIQKVFETLKETVDTSVETKTVSDLNSNTKPVQSSENQTVEVEEKVYQTDKTESSESKNNSENNESSKDLSQGIMSKITEALENSSTDDTDPVKIIKQIIDEIKLTVKQDMTKIEMQLYPEHLGKVSLQVMTKDGNLTAQITAQTSAVKEAIESQLFILRQHMEEQGLKVDTIEVTIASQGFNQNSQEPEQDLEQGKFKKSVSLGSLGEIEDDEQTALEEQIMQDNGSTVSYKA